MNNIKKNSGILLLCLVFATFFGCNPKLNSKHEVLEYINNPKNGLIQLDSNETVKASILLFPTQLLNSKEHLDVHGQYFQFNISVNGEGLESYLFKTNAGNFDLVIQQFAFNLKDNFFIQLENKRKLEALSYSFSRNYGTIDKSQFLLLFDMKDVPNDQHFTLVFKSPELLNHDIFKFRFFKEDIAQLNTLLK